MNNTSANPNEYSAREKKTSRYAAYWSLAWGVSIPLGCAGVMFLPASKLFLGIFALFIHVGIGLGAIRAHIRLLETLDEMQRKIQLEAMAMALGALWVAFGSLLILHSAELIHIDSWEVALLAVLAGLGMAIGNIIGVLRHR